MKISNYWRFIIWIAVMCYLLFIPSDQLPTKPFIEVPNFDKLVHFFLFFILCLLLFRPIKAATPNYYFWTPLVAFLLAVILESVQHKISPSRHTDFYDLLANTAGLSCAALFFRLFVSGRKIEKIM